MIKIKEKKIGSGEKTYIIAEMACAHDGDIEKAKRLVDSAVAAKADAVQLQFFSPDDLVTPDHDVYSLLKKICFTTQEWKEVYEYARSSGIAIFACTYDVPSAEMAIGLGVDGIKLNSSDLSNPDLLQLVARSNIPFTLGTGASTFDEIAKAIDTSLGQGGDQLIIMHGVQNFPTALDNAHIAKIRLLMNAFPFPVGYQDHTDASLPFSRIIDLIAIGAGACVVEKHITVDRSEKGIDYQAALEPEEFREYVQLIRTADKAFGPNKIMPLSESDQKYRLFQKKSIVAKYDLERGHIISDDNVLFLRAPFNGLAPTELSRIKGKPVIRRIPALKPVSLHDVENGSRTDM